MQPVHDGADARPRRWQTVNDHVEHSVQVPLHPGKAFTLFAERLGTWWPRGYTWGRDVLVDIGIEPREGGLCFERGPHGFRCDWGRVKRWSPGERLTITWQISPRREPEPNPSRASVVDVVFAADQGGCRITLEHRGFASHGDGADAYRAAMGSPQGWPYILSRFIDAAG